MKKVVTLAIAALVFGAMLPAAQAGKPKQKVEGSILFPAPFAQATFDGCWGGLHRRLSTPTGNAAGNGVVGFEFDVDKATWNKKFKLEVTGGQGDVDLDLFLYSHVPPVTEWPDDPQNAGFPVSVDYQTREPGGEAGKVPPKTIKAIVCMYAGPTHQGFDATFTYTAG
ncbi:MAG: hypothetical protein ACRDKT_01215 [Actinomycetota bacterium]